MKSDTNANKTKFLLLVHYFFLNYLLLKWIILAGNIFAMTYWGIHHEQTLIQCNFVFSYIVLKEECNMNISFLVKVMRICL